MEYKPLRAIISGGGTGGHIFPAISIANKLKELNPDTEILFVGAEGKMEMEKVPAAGYKIVGLPILGLQRQLNLHNIVNDLKVPFQVLKSVRWRRSSIRRVQARYRHRRGRIRHRSPALGGDPQRLPPSSRSRTASPA